VTEATVSRCKALIASSDLRMYCSYSFTTVLIAKFAMCMQCALCGSCAACASGTCLNRLTYLFTQWNYDTDVDVTVKLLIGDSRIIYVDLAFL